MSDINEFNAQTNEFVLRAYNKEELKQYQKDLNFVSQYDIVELQQDAAMSSALSKLEELGLSTEEAKRIAGI